MKIGKSIDELISTNIDIWKNATQIKKNGKPDKTLAPENRVKIFYEIRRLNYLRSSIRWDIDSKFGGQAPNETKLKYYKGK